MADNHLADKLDIAADNLGISRSKLEGLVGRGIIKAVKSDRLTLITRDEQRRYIKSLPPAVLKDRPAEYNKRKAAREVV